MWTEESRGMLGAEAWGQIRGLLKGRVPVGTAGSETGKLQPNSRPAEPTGEGAAPSRWWERGH